MLTGKSWHVNTVSTLDLGDDTVGEDVGDSESCEEDDGVVLHFGGWVFGLKNRKDY
jgi:hypothetical protein